MPTDAGLYLLGAGVGATAAVALARVGVRADALGATVTVAISGAILALAENRGAGRPAGAR